MHLDRAVRTALVAGLAGAALYACSDTPTGTEGESEPTPVNQVLTEVIGVRDSVIFDLGPVPLAVPVAEVVAVTDSVIIDLEALPVDLVLTEAVAVSDSVLVELGPAPIHLTVAESVAISDSVIVELGNAPPEAMITAPADSASFIVGDTVTLAGTATDAEEDTLTGPALAWSSDLDGALGTGPTVTRSDLSVGTHDIALVATDSVGAADTARITLRMTPAPTGVLAFVSERTGTREIFTMNADGTGQTQLTTSVDNVHPAVSPEGTRISYGDGGPRGTWVMNADGTGITSLVDYRSGSPSWAPDGSGIAIQASVSGSEDWEIYIVDPATGDSIRRLSDNSAADQYPAWSPDGSQVALMRDGGLTVISATDGSTIQSFGVGGRHPAWSPDGTRIAYNTFTYNGVADIVVLDVATGETSQVTRDSAVHFFPTWSPDGRYLAYARGPERTGPFDLFIAHADGSGHAPRQLTTDPADDGYPDWADSIAEPANQPPTAEITSPADSATFAAADTIDFQGAGTDPEDGALTGTSLAWRSDLDGALGTGATPGAVLSTGTHTVTLTATDGDGATGTDSITVIVQDTTALTVSVAAAPDPVAVDSTLSHTVTLANNGPTSVTGVHWTLVVEGEVLIGSPVPEGCDTFTSSDPPSKLFDCSLDSLSTGEIRTFQAHVVPQAGDTLVSTARLESWVGAMDTNAADNVAVDSTVVVAGTLTASITDPADSAAYLPGTSITFQGSASDPEDGTLTGSALAWASDLDGPLGTGDSVTTPLTLGTHTVTLTATDSDGNADTAAVSVVVSDTALLFMSERGPLAHEFDVFRVLADGSTESITPFAGDDGPAEWSPDGTRIVFKTQRCVYTVCIWNMAVDRSDTVEIDNGDGAYYDRDPTWSPDGTQIAFTREPSSNLGTNALYVIDADGANAENLTGTSANWDTDPEWSPTGSQIVFRSERNDTSGLFLIDPDGTGLTRLTSETDIDPAWSFTGRIAFARLDIIDGGYAHNIYTMTATGGDVRRLTSSASHDYAPAWSADGTRIYFVSNRDGNSEIYVMNADGTGVARVTRDAAADAAPDVQP